jgi:hypothetical protein
MPLPVAPPRRDSHRDLIEAWRGVLALPFTNRAHAAHPAFTENVAKLRSWGVTVLFGPDVYPFARAGDRQPLPAPVPLGYDG